MASKRKLHRMVLDLQQRVSELEDRLHYHAMDCTRHATPAAGIPDYRQRDAEPWVPIDGTCVPVSPPPLVVTTGTWVAENAQH